MADTALLLGRAKSGQLIRKRALAATTVAVRTLDAQTQQTAFALFQRTYQGADRCRFEHDLGEKQLVILLRDRDTGELKGFSTVLLQSVRTSAGSSTVVFSGDTVIEREYWGQKQLQKQFAWLLFRLKLSRPRRPLYWFLISKGYRTYLLLANAFPRAVPRCDRADDPALRRVLDTLATERFGAQYEPRTGVIRFETPHEFVRDGVAPLDPRLLANSHVRFFLERNPGHAQGDELACLAEVRVADLMRAATRIAAKRARHRLAGT
jgi:hypothetical protein